MDAPRRESATQYLDRWKRIGSELSAIRRRELRAYDVERSRELLDDLLRMAADHAKPRATTGLIHLQRLLRNRYA